MAVRTSWSGTINFGLVSVPVGTCGAVTENDVRFSQFHAVDGELNPVGRKEYDKVTGDEVTRSEITRGFVQADGSVVPVTDEDIAALAPRASKTIEVDEFVDEASIDPLYYSRHEYAIPAKGAGKAYRLLYLALDSTGRVGVGRTVRRSKEHTVLVRASGGALVLTFLSYADEVRAVSDLGIEDTEVKDAELDMAVALVSAMQSDWQPTKYRDEQRERVLAMLAAKGEGRTIDAPQDDVVPSDSGDVMALLAASIERAAAAAA